MTKRQDIQKWLDLLKKVPDCRESKVRRIKEEINKGSYITADKLEKAYEKLIEEVASY